MPVVILVYNLVTLSVICLLWPIWLPLVMGIEKYRATFFKRLFPDWSLQNRAKGSYDNQRIWIHALSVGEVLSAAPLVNALRNRYDPHDILFTASTRTGIETARRVISPHVFEVRHFPYDTHFSVKRAIRIFNPRQVIIVETDIWPNFLNQLQRQDIPVYLVNARISSSSFKGYRQIRFLMSPLLSIFKMVCVQTRLDRQRFVDLGVPRNRLAIVGNIKFDQTPIDVADDEMRRLADRLSLHPASSLWVAGSTHEGEEIALLRACLEMEASGVRSTLLIAPRNPQRADDICRLFRHAGIDTLSMTQAEQAKKRASVVVIDRIGVLRQLYALADVAFVGGSLVEEGGHNPLEPAAVAKPILFGPHTEDFRWICQALENAGGAKRVHDANQLARAVGQLFTQRHVRQRMGKHAYAVFAANRGAVARTLDAIDKDNHGQSA